MQKNLHEIIKAKQDGKIIIESYDNYDEEMRIDDYKFVKGHIYKIKNKPQKRPMTKDEIIDLIEEYPNFRIYDGSYSETGHPIQYNNKTGFLKFDNKWYNEERLHKELKYSLTLKSEILEFEIEV